MIRALEKAQSLARFAKEQGAPLTEYDLTLTLPEAFELLDYLGTGGMGWYQNHPQLIADIVQAKSTNDPWPVLANFEIEGFAIRSVLH